MEENFACGRRVDVIASCNRVAYIVNIEIWKDSDHVRSETCQSTAEEQWDAFGVSTKSNRSAASLALTILRTILKHLAHKIAATFDLVTLSAPQNNFNRLSSMIGISYR